MVAATIKLHDDERNYIGTPRWGILKVSWIIWRQYYADAIEYCILGDLSA